MSLLDIDKDYDYNIIKQCLINVDEKDVPALQQAWYDTYGMYGLGGGSDPRHLIRLLELYRDDLGIPYKSSKYSNGPIYISTHIIDHDIINAWVNDFNRGEYFTKIEDLATFAVGCLNISWKILSQFELGIYKNSYLIDHPVLSFYPMGNINTVKSKYDFYRQRIETIIDMIKKGII